MPVVTIDPEKFERFELKSAPPDGYVMLRPLPYGMKLTRRSNSSRMMMEAGATRMTLETLEEWTTAFDFKHCIGEHNLQNLDGSPVDFGNAIGWKTVDPRVGSEIERLIGELNEEEDQVVLDDFLRQSATSSTEDQNKSPMGSGGTPPSPMEVANADS